MILVDPRESTEMLTLIRARVNGQARYAKPQLNSGDYAFQGNGPTGDIVVGIERKRLGDMLSSERSGRYICQLEKMSEEYAICVLIVESIHRPTESGLIETATRGGWGPLNLSTVDQRKSGTRWNEFRYFAELDNFETSLELRRDVIVKHSSNKLHSAWIIVNLYNYFQKVWSSHSSTEQVKIQSGIVTRKASYLRMMAAQLPGIGWERAGKVERHFQSIGSMVNSTPSQWEEIDGIGKKTALEVCRIIREEYK